MESADRELVSMFQRNELTEHIIYQKLSQVIKNKQQSEILKRISEEELLHYDLLKGLNGEESMPDKLKISWFVFMSRFLGLNFGLKLMESGEHIAQVAYERLKSLSPKIESIIRDEEKHETELISLIDEEHLKYVSSIVLGLNDALGELTGALAGFTLALQNTHIIGMVGLITGIAASLSMASSEYLSTKHEDTDKNPLKASIYTGITYVGTVLLLILPYFLCKSIFIALGLTIAIALLLMLIFTFYVSVAKGLNFKKRFLEMAALSLTITVISFFIGLAARKFFGVDV